MISTLMFINQKGEILIYRVYKDDTTRSECLQFCSKVVATKENKESPIIQINGIIIYQGTSYIHIQHKDIIILASTKNNVNVAMVIQFLYNIVMICKSYFRGELDEKCIRENFVLIYELLDGTSIYLEICDYGIPQITDAELLKKYIQEGGMKAETMNDIQKLKQLTQQATGVTSWRPQGIKYKKNQVYLDIIENVNVLFSPQSSILRVEVSGTVRVKCELSDMPECKFGMNEKVLLEKEQKGDSKRSGINISDLKFHQCVRLGKFDKDRSITFIPPDGQFDLMTYRVDENINLPFKIIPIFNILPPNKSGRYKIDCIVKIKSIFDQNLFGQNLVLKIPCPKNTINVVCSNSIGKAKYEPEQGAVLWRVKKFNGDTESIMRCDIDVSTSSNDKPWIKPPIQLEFQIPMFTPSGLRVRYLRVFEKSGYKPVKWIRYLAKSGEYHHRL